MIVLTHQASQISSVSHDFLNFPLRPLRVFSRNVKIEILQHEEMIAKGCVGYVRVLNTQLGDLVDYHPGVSSGGVLYVDPNYVTLYYFEGATRFEVIKSASTVLMKPTFNAISPTRYHSTTASVLFGITPYNVVTLTLSDGVYVLEEYKTNPVGLPNFDKAILQNGVPIAMSGYGASGELLNFISKTQKGCFCSLFNNHRRDITSVKIGNDEFVLLNQSVSISQLQRFLKGLPITNIESFLGVYPVAEHMLGKVSGTLQFLVKDNGDFVNFDVVNFAEVSDPDGNGIREFVNDNSLSCMYVYTSVSEVNQKLADLEIEYEKRVSDAYDALNLRIKTSINTIKSQIDNLRKSYDETEQQYGDLVTIKRNTKVSVPLIPDFVMPPLGDFDPSKTPSENITALSSYKGVLEKEEFGYQMDSEICKVDSIRVNVRKFVGITHSSLNEVLNAFGDVREAIEKLRDPREAVLDVRYDFSDVPVGSEFGLDYKRSHSNLVESWSETNPIYTPGFHATNFQNFLRNTYRWGKRGEVSVLSEDGSFEINDFALDTMYLDGDECKATYVARITALPIAAMLFALDESDLHQTNASVIKALLEVMLSDVGGQISISYIGPSGFTQDEMITTEDSYEEFMKERDAIRHNNGPYKSAPSFSKRKDEFCDGCPEKSNYYTCYALSEQPKYAVYRAAEYSLRISVVKRVPYNAIYSELASGDLNLIAMMADSEHLLKEQAAKNALASFMEYLDSVDFYNAKFCVKTKYEFLSLMSARLLDIVSIACTDEFISSLQAILARHLNTEVCKDLVVSDLSKRQSLVSMAAELNELVSIVPIFSGRSLGPASRYSTDFAGLIWSVR